MRHTPFFDKYGITFKKGMTEEQTDHLVNVLDSAMAEIERSVEWGSWQGLKRKPCPEQPLLLAGQPIGMYHCPYCGMMSMAGLPHPSPAAPPHQDPHYPMDDYEIEYGSPGNPQPWPPGYEEEG